MTNQETNLREIAEIENLKVVETTPNGNGYPEHLKLALIGFDSWKQLEEIKAKYNLNDAIHLEKKDGWQLWYRNSGSAYEEFTNNATDYGDDYREETNAEAFMKNEMEDCFPYMEFETFEEVTKWIKEKQKIYDELLLIDDTQVVITNQGNYYETISKRSMSFNNDGRTFTIGLV